MMSVVSVHTRLQGPAKELTRCKPNHGKAWGWGLSVQVRLNDGRRVSLWFDEWEDIVELALIMVWQVPALYFEDDGVEVSKALAVVNRWLRKKRREQEGATAKEVPDGEA